MSVTSQFWRVAGQPLPDVFVKYLHIKTAKITMWQNKFSISCMGLAPYGSQSKDLQIFGERDALSISNFFPDKWKYINLSHQNIVDEAVSCFWSANRKRMNVYWLIGHLFHYSPTKRIAIKWPCWNSALLGLRDIQNMISWVTEPESYLVDGVIFPQTHKLTWFKDS